MDQAPWLALHWVELLCVVGTIVAVTLGSLIGYAVADWQNGEPWW